MYQNIIKLFGLITTTNLVQILTTLKLIASYQYDANNHDSKEYGSVNFYQTVVVEDYVMNCVNPTLKLYLN
uniref:Uncharacterized protein n=1 Tax=Schistosoma curassoni TaxID=6186 RepID=A0A183KY15_9TREM